MNKLVHLLINSGVLLRQGLSKMLLVNAANLSVKLLAPT